MNSQKKEEKLMNPIYVSSIGDNIFISNVPDNCDIENELLKIGAYKCDSIKGTLVIDTNGSLKECAHYCRLIRDLEIPFSYGRDWCPSAVVQDLRDKGLIKGKLKEINWSSPEIYSIIDI